MGEGEGGKEKMRKIVREREGVKGEGRETGGMRDGLGGRWMKEKRGISVVSMAM